MGDQRLPDTPWHVGYAKKKDDDPRRHKHNCIHYNKGKCICTRSQCYNTTCGGSSHCSEYAITTDQYKQDLEERKTVEELEQDKIDSYKRSFEPKKKKIMAEGHRLQYLSVDEMQRCLVCDDFLLKVPKTPKGQKGAKLPGIKKCKYCGMYFIDNMDDILQKVIGNNAFLLMNRKELKPQYAKRHRPHNTNNIVIRGGKRVRD